MILFYDTYLTCGLFNFTNKLIIKIDKKKYHSISCYFEEHIILLASSHALRACLKAFPFYNKKKKKIIGITCLCHLLK